MVDSRQIESSLRQGATGEGEGRVAIVGSYAYDESAFSSIGEGTGDRLTCRKSDGIRLVAVAALGADRIPTRQRLLLQGVGARLDVGEGRGCRSARRRQVKAGMSRHRAGESKGRVATQRILDHDQLPILSAGESTGNSFARIELNGGGVAAIATGNRTLLPTSLHIFAHAVSARE